LFEAVAVYFLCRSVSMVMVTNNLRPLYGGLAVCECTSSCFLLFHYCRQCSSWNWWQAWVLVVFGWWCYSIV